MAVVAAPVGASSGTSSTRIERVSASEIPVSAHPVAHASSTPSAQIDAGALAHNYGEVTRLVGGGTGVIAMIKSDAYGHGAPLCASILARAGCSRFGVATIDEAIEIQPVLQQATGSQRARIVVLGGVLAGEAAAAVDAGIEVTTQEIDVVRAIGASAAASGSEALVHVKIDTGMHRLGIAPEDAVDFVRAASAVRGVRVVAICSHFAQAESVTGEVTAGQLEAMLGADRALREAGFALERHLANSAAILSRPDAHLDVVRPGIMLYGVAPDPALRGRADLRPVMTLVARVIRVADVPRGDGIGYGHTFRTSRPTRLATVRFGYADGYPRCLGNLAVASVAGTRVPLVGRICMDHAMFDVTDAPPVSVGDEVTLWGDDPRVEEIASLADTIAYELLARVGRRVRRETK
ncbi:MAG TPA: alanine racemase [Candidatus Limnocylindrales bacterium]|nr:alanine racemase [Candidatus Limnocylindrales bacterium]